MRVNRWFSGAFCLAAMLAVLFSSAPVFADAPAAPAAASKFASVGEAFDSWATRDGDGPATVRLLTDNMDSWYSRWYILERAQKTIDVTYFIVEPDVFGMSLVGMLLKKAKEGVKVRLMVDARGTKGIARTLMGQDYLQELVIAGAEVKVFNPLTAAIPAMFGDLRNLLASNHDKLLIVDGEWGVTGGRNISKNYFADPRDMANCYRDTDVLLRGPLVSQAMTRAFDEEWNGLHNADIKKDLFGNWKSRSLELEFARRAMSGFINARPLVNPEKLEHGDLLKNFYDQLKAFPHLNGYAAFEPFQGERACPVKILDKSSIRGDLNEIAPGLIDLVRAAKKEILIQNPYVVLTPLAAQELDAAAKRGVRVVVLTNSPVSSDSALTQAFFLNDWEGMMAKIPSMRLFGMNTVRKLHAKTLVIDGEIALVGTYNADPCSAKTNSEVVAIIKSKPFAERSRLRIAKDIETAVEYKIKIGADGKPTSTFGPRDHSDPKKIRMLDWLRKLKFLRPLI